ncbi:MAG: outer membrane protein assembly factor [Burkholderiaceae bacterium]|nr:MAG: outer membrane protein assembly factor [Burkholderiaceae bacterium]
MAPAARPPTLGTVTLPLPRFARTLIWPALLALTLAGPLSGCAALDGGDKSHATTADAGAATDETKTASSEPEQKPAFDIRVECKDDALRKLVEEHTELRRYRVVTDLDATELERLMALGRRDVRDLLATQGYFSPTITISRAGEPGARPTVVIAIEPGPATRIQNVDIDFTGDIARSTNAGAMQQREAIVSDWTLADGRRFTQERWSDAKTDALRRLVERRYPQGKISQSRADIHADRAQADLSVTLDSGPPFHLGPAAIKGARLYPPELAPRLSWLKPGDVYDQKKLVDAQGRLAASGYYQSAYISVDPKGDPAAVPVRYLLTEAKPKKVQLGIGYSTDTGPRLSVEHRNNLFWGSTWRAETKLQLDKTTPLLQWGLTSLPNAEGWSRAGLARFMRQDDGALVTTSKTLRAGVAKTEENYDRNFYLQFDDANVTGSGTQAVPDALLGDGAALSVNYDWTGRYFDSLPFPSRGYGLSLNLAAGFTVIGRHLPFTRIQGRWLGIVPISKKSGRIALRAEAGAVLSSTQARIPATYLFRTGGDTTVRGYSYRSIGIPVGDGLVGPGRYMAVGSVEWQRPILQQRFHGLLEQVYFVDVGSVANLPNHLRPNWGVGTGVRINSPVGPMELDLAYGLQSRAFRLHMNVGFTF